MDKQIIGIVAGVLTSSSIIPQLVKTIKTKEVADLSIYIFIILIAGNSLWGYYGILLKDIPLIATSIFSVVLNITMLILKIKYS